MLLTVIIPTYNPQWGNLNEVVNSLRAQTLPTCQWELIIIDNNSNNGVIDTIKTEWHPNSKVIKVLQQGLTFSRIAGLNDARGEVIVMVDDDNLLAPDYLEMTLKHFKMLEFLGAAGGINEGRFDNYVPEEWTKQFWGSLAIRDLGDQPIVSPPNLSSGYPACSPVGAGMALKKSLMADYMKQYSEGNVITDRTGNNLASGGDNEIVIHILKQGFSVAYFPDLKLQHIIPASRLSKAYLSRLIYESSISWITLLLKYHICPWPEIPAYTVPLRKLKAWIKNKTWLNKANYIKWKGACGLFEALAKK